MMFVTLADIQRYVVPILEALVVGSSEFSYLIDGRLLRYVYMYVSYVLIV